MTSPIPSTGPENPNPVMPPTTGSGEPMFTAAQLEAARKQEKDKLYAQLEDLREQQKQHNEALAAIQKAKESELAAVQAAEAAKAEEARKKAEAEMSAKALLEQKLAETTQTWEQKFQQMEAERAQEKALLDKERAYQELVAYRNNAITSAGDDIAPQFFDFIAGETKEQIDAGISRAREATESIAKQFQEAQKIQLSQMRGVSTAGYASLGPIETNPTQTTVTAEQIRDMSMADFAKLRAQTGIGAAESRSNRGLFG